MTPTPPPDDAKLQEGLATLTAGAEQQARQDFWHHTWPRIVGVVALVALLVGGVASWGLYNLYGRQVTTEVAVSTLRTQADAAKLTGDKANRELADRGQPQVPIPQPGTNVDAEVITSSATARVLASLPDFKSTPAELGQAVATYLARNPIGPTPLQLSSALAAYFTTSPPPSGPPGATGEPGIPGQPGGDGGTGPEGPAGPKGDPPTAEEIQGAFVQYIKDNPDTLCPNGGSFAQLSVRLADGGSADSWQCVVAVYPPSPTTSAPGFPILPTN